MRPSPRARKEWKGTHSSCTCEALCTSYFQDFWCFFFDACLAQRARVANWVLLPKMFQLFRRCMESLEQTFTLSRNFEVIQFLCHFHRSRIFSILMGFTLAQGCDAKMSYFSLCNRAPVPMSRSRERTMKARHCRRCL
jgi:hypothetical protein